MRWKVMDPVCVDMKEYLIGCLGAVSMLLAVPGCQDSRCTPGEERTCICADGTESVRICDDSGDSFGACLCGEEQDAGAGDAGSWDAAVDASPEDGAGPDAVAPAVCEEDGNGTYCDGADLVGCRNGREFARIACDRGCDESLPEGEQACEPPDQGFCQDKLNGLWCDGPNLVRCQDDRVADWETCLAGCVSMPPGTNDECAPLPFCTAVPDKAEASPPTEACNYMDWQLSSDGFYLISRFGTSADSTTWGHGTSCGFLQDHYDAHGCRYDNQAGACLDDQHEIPFVQGTVDYDYDTVIATVDQYAPDDVPVPEYFYVAGAQRFNCGALLRVSNPANGRCVVVYTEDGGPGERYEEADRGGRRILDASPAVVRFLGVEHIGWANSDLVYVEWGKPGDVPGQACFPCESVPAESGTEDHRTPWDLNHMMSVSCR